MSEHHNDGRQTMSPQEMKATGSGLKRLAIYVAAILIAGFIAVYIVKAHHEHSIAQAAEEAESAPPSVVTVTAQKAPASLPLSLPGETAAWYSSIIYARVDGYVGNWTADIGDHVKKGQVLATIETPDLDAQLAAAQAKLRADQALVEFTQSTYERWQNSPKGVVSQQEREAKKADYDRAMAQAGLDQADIDRFTALTQFKQVTAPYDGVITERRIDIGNLVTAGSTSSTTSLYRIVQDDPIRVFADVPQRVAQDMKVGLDAHITASTIPGKTFDGKITRTADAIDEHTRTLRVEVDIPNPDSTLVSGLYVDVAFELPGEGLIQVPAAALVFQASGPEIAVIGQDDKVDFHKVTIARDNGNTLEIGSGINAGDRMALNISHDIHDGEKVNVSDEADQSHAPAQK